MGTADFSVFLIDDDPGVLKALTRLLQTAGYKTKAFSSSEAFLDEHDPSVPGCAVLDLTMPGLDGLEVQQKLAGKATAPAHRFSDRPWKRSGQRARDEGRGGGLPPEACQTG